MKISLKWLNDYLDIKLSNLELSDKLTELGLEATYKRIGKTFEGIVVGKVLSCKSHPNADKLSVCEVDIGNDIKSNIVCGAPNVKKNIYVPVAKIGAKLDNGKFKIKKAKLRGVVSEGMICSGKELGYNDDHNGILILKKEVQLGIPIEDVINFNDDIVFDLDLTPNRGDCLGHLGVAREIGIIQKTMVKQKHANINENHEDISNNIRVAIEAVEGCSRYTGRIIKGVKVGPSPYWLKSRLESVGIKSINNIVDAANYVLMDTGHPMHTFDLDKIDDNKIHVRYALDGEEINFLDGSKKQLKEFHLVIADDKKSLALAGIMGSENSGITNETKNIFIESAYFDPKIIRKGAKSLDLSTDASHRFERDTDIDNLIPSLNQLAEIINKIAGGEILKNIIDIYPSIRKHKKIDFSFKNCNDFLGINQNKEDYLKIFNLLSIKCIENNDIIECEVPSFRNDLEREVDLFEEVARIFGYNNIPTSDKFIVSLNSFSKDKQILDSGIRNHLGAIGFYEHYSNSLINKTETNYFPCKEAVQIINPLSREMEYLRNSILPGLLKAASYNEKRQQNTFKLFEIGSIHNISDKTNTGTLEVCSLGMLWYGQPQLHWREYDRNDLFKAKGDVSNLLKSYGFENLDFTIDKGKGFENYLKIIYDSLELGFIGIPDKNILKSFDLDSIPIICDLNMIILRDLYGQYKLNYNSPTQYPSSIRDISIQVEKDISSSNIIKTIKNNGGIYLQNIILFDVYYGEEVGGQNKSLAFSLKFQSVENTLKDFEVDNALNKIMKNLKKTHGAIQR